MICISDTGTNLLDRSIMNYEKELNGFLEYAGHYDRTNGMIELKVVHTLRVAPR